VGSCGGRGGGIPRGGGSGGGVGRGGAEGERWGGLGRKPAVLGLRT